MLRGEFDKFIRTLDEKIVSKVAKSDADSSEQQIKDQAEVVQKVFEDLLPDIEALDREREKYHNTNDEVNGRRAAIEALRQHIQASAAERAQKKRDERQFEEIVNENREKLESAAETERDAVNEFLNRAQADLNNCRQTITDLNAAIGAAETDRTAAQTELDQAEVRLQTQEKRLEASYEKVNEKIQNPLNALNDLSEKIIFGIFPGDGTPFLVENNSKLPLQEPDDLLDQIRSLKRDPKGAESEDAAPFFRLNCKSLEEEMQSLLDHLTAKRVAEEMDGQTYVNRLRGNFSRIRRNAETAIKTLSEEQEKTQRAEEHLQHCQSLVAAMRGEFSWYAGQIQTEADIREGDDKNESSNVDLQVIEYLCKNGAFFCERLGDFLKQSKANLKNLQSDFCSALNRDAAEQQSRLVSQAIERSLLLRFYPLFVATAFTILVKGILARNNAQILHDNSVAILVVSFVVSWAFSIWVGFSSRRKKMTALRMHTARQIRNIITPYRSDPQRTNLTFKPLKRLVSWIKRSVAKSRQMLLDRRLIDEAVKFPSIAYKANSEGYKDNFVFQWRTKNFQQTITVVALNFVILAIPSAVFFGWDRFLGNTVPDRGEHRLFVARLPEAPPCVLAKGRLVFATKADYFIRVSAPITGWIERIFPEIGAQVVPRDQVIRVIPTNHADDVDGLLNCTATDPNHNTLRIHHEGKVLDALGEEEVRQEIFSGLQKIAENLSGAPTAVWSPETDPEIAEARDEMEELLAVTDPSEFDGRRFVAAFGRIQQSLAEKLVIAEKLSIADTMRLTWPRTGSLTPSIKFPNPLQVDLLDQEEIEALTDLVARIAASNEKLAQLIKREIPLGNNPAVVVLPILHELQEKTPSSEVKASTWVTNFLLSNGAPAGKDWPDTLILPFFNNEVSFRDKNDMMAYERQPLQMAFVFGAREENFDDPVLGSATEGTYFGRIAKHLDQCLQSTGDQVLSSDDTELTLDIIGLASPTWKDNNRKHLKEQLNLALAEGRRAATLYKLAKAISDKGTQNRIHIMISDSPTDTLSLAQISDLLAGERKQWFASRFKFNRFSNPDELKVARSKFISASASGGENRVPLEELFARSVIFKVESVSGGPCANS